MTAPQPTAGSATWARCAWCCTDAWCMPTEDNIGWTWWCCESDYKLNRRDIREGVTVVLAPSDWVTRDRGQPLSVPPPKDVPQPQPVVQPVLPPGQPCAWCGQPATGLGSINGVTLPYCPEHLAAVSQMLSAPQGQPDSSQPTQAERLRDAAMRYWRPGEPVPEGLDPAAAEADYQMGVLYHARTEQQRRDARRQVDAEARQPVALVAASVVRQRQPPPYLVEGLIPAAPSIGVFFGESGTYKSFLVLNLLLCAGADGAWFLGHAVTGGGLGIYVMGEGQYDAGLRLDAATGAADGFTDEHLAYIEQAFPLSDESAVDELIAAALALAAERGRPVLLVVFDSFADFYGAGDSENSNTDMQRLIASMKRISAALGCVVMANAHTGHGGVDEDGNEKPPPTRLRGASRFRQAWDFELMATGSALVPTKNRYGPKAGVMEYTMEQRGGSLVLAQRAAAGSADSYEPPPQFPHPCPFDAWEKVAKAVSATPGMSLNQIAKVAKVRKEYAGLALMKSEQAAMMINTGTKASPKWAMGGGFYDWWMRGGGPPDGEAEPPGEDSGGNPDGGSASSLGACAPYALAL